MDILGILFRAWHDRDRADDKADAFVDSILPEVADWFVGLFQNEDKDSFFAKLNAFILSAYLMAPDFLQFFVRYLSNVGLEKLQRRWPSWASTPVLIFIKAYFDALEKASKGKPKPDMSELRARLDELAAQAKDSASELGKQFQAAWEAAKNIKKPKPETTGPKEGPHMSEPHPAPKGPAASDTGDKAKAPKKSFAERVEAAKAALVTVGAGFGWFIDRTEDHAQSVANGLFWVAGVILVTATTTLLATFVDNDRLMVVNVGWWSLVWILGPFMAAWSWRNHNRRIAAQEASRAKASGNPYEQPGNGWLELGALVSAVAFVELVSTLVVAILCAVAAYTHFASAYVWCGLAAIGAAFFGYIFLDVGLDTLRAIGQVIPDEYEGAILKARNRAARSFSLIGIIYGLLMLGPVLIYLVAHTDYTGSSFVLGLYLALVAGFANTRLGSEPGVAAPETVKDVWIEFVRRNFKSAQKILLLSAVVIVGNAALDNLIFPPKCLDTDNDPETVEVCDKLPSYAARWQNSSAFKLFGAAGARVGHEADANEAEAPVVACSTQVITFVNGLERGDCKVILSESTDTTLVGLCKQAVECGAVTEGGVKQGNLHKSQPITKTDKIEVDPSSPWSWVCLVTACALVLLAILGWKEPKKEEKKSGGH